LGFAEEFYDDGELKK
jgi:hypothetical protein